MRRPAAHTSGCDRSMEPDVRRSRCCTIRHDHQVEGVDRCGKLQSGASSICSSGSSGWKASMVGGALKALLGACFNYPKTVARDGSCGLINCRAGGVYMFRGVVGMF